MTQSQSRSRGRSKRLEEKTETRVVTYRRISTNETNQPHSLGPRSGACASTLSATPVWF